MQGSVRVKLHKCLDKLETIAAKGLEPFKRLNRCLHFAKRQSWQGFEELVNWVGASFFASQLVLGSRFVLRCLQKLLETLTH
jgi:hypothetical protein